MIDKKNIDKNLREIDIVQKEINHKKKKLYEIVSTAGFINCFFYDILWIH